MNPIDLHRVPRRPASSDASRWAVIRQRLRSLLLGGAAIVSFNCYGSEPYKWIDSSGIVHLDDVTAGSVAMSGSEIHYAGASPTHAFTAMEPYEINIMGALVTSKLGGKARTHDFSGATSFVNPQSGAPDPAVIQGWDGTANTSVNLASVQISNAGLPGRVDKRNNLTMIRYNASDGITGGTCRTQLVSYPIPPRTHVRWELVVAFGAADMENSWVLTPPKQSPVLFWEVKSPSGGNPSLSAVVDTDPSAQSQYLMLTFYQKGGKAPAIAPIAQVSKIPRTTMIPIVIEAFLDERERIDGGKGRERIWVNGTMIADVQGPTLTWGPGEHRWVLAEYLYREPQPYVFTRASFWTTARMMVFP